MSNRKLLEKAIEAKINGASDNEVQELMHEYFVSVGKDILAEAEFNDVEDDMEGDFMSDVGAEDEFDDESETFMDDEDLDGAEDELGDSMGLDDDMEEDGSLNLDDLSDEEKSELEDTLASIQSLFDKINAEDDEDDMDFDDMDSEEEFEEEGDDFEDKTIGDDLDELEGEEEIEEAVELQKVNAKVDVGSEMGAGKKVSVEDNKLLPTDGHDVVKHKAGSMKLKGDEGKTKKPATSAKGSNSTEVHNRVKTASQTKAKNVDKGYTKSGVDPSGKGGSK